MGRLELTQTERTNHPASPTLDWALSLIIWLPRPLFLPWQFTASDSGETGAINKSSDSKGETKHSP